MADPITLSVDCGGGGIKATALNALGTIIAPAVRTVTPYPLPPQLLIDTIERLASSLPQPDRITVGMPGMVRHGVVIATPHYVTKAGPRTRVLPELVAAWVGLDLQRELTAVLGVPVLLLKLSEWNGACEIAWTRTERDPHHGLCM